LARKWADDFMLIHPDVNIEVSKDGTGRGISDLIAGKCQLAMISRPLVDNELDAGLWYVTVAKDGVVPIVNQKNPYFEKILSQGLSPDEYLKAFTSDNPLTWGELLDTSGNEKTIVFSRADESGAADIFANFFFKESSDLRGTKVTGDEEMIKSIQENSLGIGFCNFSYAFNASTGERVKDIQVIPADLDYDNKIDRKEIPFSNLAAARRGIWLGIYPRSLCRELTISSLGKPTDPAIVEFLRYVLSDGQKIIEEKGLCELNDAYLKYSLDKLN
jgi:phosphate transport system substrate-binding protein